MTFKRVEPSISAASFNCPHCGALSQQTWHMLFARRIGNNGTPLQPTEAGLQLLRVQTDLECANATDDAELEKLSQKLEYLQRLGKGEVFFDAFLNTVLTKEVRLPQAANVHASQCYSCEQIALWAGNRLVFPSGQIEVEPNADLPDEVRADYKEAAGILGPSPRGAAALLRLCIQKLCKHLGERGDDINDDIASLVKKGLDVRVQQSLDIVRVVGNEAVHPGQLDLRDDRQTALSLFRLVNLVAEKTISEPKHVAEIYSGLPKGKRDAIEKRDKSGRR
jgi:hypothetical protein